MINVTKDKGVMVIEDDENPRIYQRYFKCHQCKEWIEEDEIVWVNLETGEATVMNGEPFHVYCAPPEHED